MVEEIRELVERCGKGRIGSEELALLVPMMLSQGFSLDGQSFLLGALLGPNVPRAVLIPFALSLNQNPATAPGTTVPGPMGNNLFPFLLLSLLNYDVSESDEKKFQVIEKKSSSR